MDCGGSCATLCVALAINCGGPAYQGVDGVAYEPDQSFTEEVGAGLNAFCGADECDAVNECPEIAATTDDALYRTDRYCERYFSYHIPLDNGPYRVELHFAEIWFGTNRTNLTGPRVFDVSMEGVPVLDDFNPAAAAGLSLAAVVASHDVSLADGVLDIDLAQVAPNTGPKISAIVIRRRPMVVAPPSCTDQIQNQGETGVDCGGPCPACVVPTDGIFVAPNGVDTNNGTMGSPVQTLERARNLVQAIKTAGLPTGGVNVWLRAGVYARSSVFELTAQDAGEAGKPIVYRGYPGEHAVVAGGVSIPPNAFAPATAADPNWGRLNTAARNNIFVADLSVYTSNYGQHLQHNVSMHTMQELVLDEAGVVYNHRAMMRARWPNPTTDAYGIEHSLADTVVNARPSGCDCGIKAGCTNVGINSSRPSGWQRPNEVWFESVSCHPWDRHAFHVTGISGSTLTLDMATVNKSDGFRANAPLYLYNILEELDIPGEWYVDETNGRLYIYPPTGSVGVSDTVVFSTLTDPVIALSNTHHVTVQDLTVEAGRGALVSIKGGNNNVLQGSHLVGSTVRAMDVQTFEPFGSNVFPTQTTILDNEIADSFTAIIVHGEATNDWIQLIPQNLVIHNNEIHHIWWYGILYTGRTVGHTISNNEIHDTGYVGLRFRGPNHMIELNEFTRVLTDIADYGAIYGGLSLVDRSTIRHNFIHNVRSSVTFDRANGIYLDEGLSGITVYGNIVEDVPNGIGVFLCGGMDNNISNNIFVRTRWALGTLNNLSWIVLPTTEGHSHVLGDLYPVPYRNSAWQTAFPALYALPQPICAPAYNNPACCSAYSPRPICGGVYSASCTASYADSNGCCCQAIDTPSWQSRGFNSPLNSRFVNNVCWQNQTWCTGDLGYGGSAIALGAIENTPNMEGADPLFVNEGALDFNLQSGSPVYTNLPGFQPIPFDAIGRQ